MFRGKNQDLETMRPRAARSILRQEMRHIIRKGRRQDRFEAEKMDPRRDIVELVRQIGLDQHVPSLSGVRGLENAADMLERPAVFIPIVGSETIEGLEPLRPRIFEALRSKNGNGHQ